MGHRHEGHRDVEHDSHQGEGSHDHRKENWSSYHHGKYHHVKVKLHGKSHIYHFQRGWGVEDLECIHADTHLRVNGKNS